MAANRLSFGVVVRGFSWGAAMFALVWSCGRATAAPMQAASAPTVALSVSATTFPLAAPASATVQVSCNSACGLVDFQIDGSEWGTVPLNAAGGFSTISYPTLTPGLHSLQVYYLGNGTYSPAASSAVSFMVVPNGATAPSVVIMLEAASFLLSAPTSVTAQVSCNTACGEADFRIDGSEWGTVQLGSAGSFTTSSYPALAVGAHTLQVVYRGNATYAAAASNIVNFTILPEGATTPSVVLAMGATTFPLAAPPSAVVQVSCNSACGQADFRIDGLEWGTVALSSTGSFSTISYPALTVGVHTLQVFYLGNATYPAAASNPISFTVVPNGSTVSSAVLSMGSTSFKLNSAPNAIVQVNCNTACGQADFRIDGAEWGTVPLGSTGSFTTSSYPGLTVGTHALQVFYLGNATYAPAASNVVNFTVVSIGTTATPAFTPAAGTYLAVQTVAMTDTTAGAAIYYTTDGTTPTTSSTLYSGPIQVASTKTLKALALAPGYTASAVGSAAYTVNIVAVTVNGGGQVRLGSTAQLTATVTNTNNTAVTWKVNSVVGGSATAGTISTAGLYTPPVTLPGTNPVAITAVSVAAPTASGTASEAVLNPLPAVSSATVTVVNAAATGLLDVIGTGFVSGAQLQVSGSSVTTVFVSGTELQATIPVTAGTTTVAVDVLNPDPGSTTSVSANAAVTALKASQQAAARLLDQATFGPTLTDIQHVETVGVQGYLTEQFALPATLEPDIANPAPLVCMNSTVPCQQSEWWQTALTAPDQLRQRVAFALSEMFVISTNSVNARSVTTFQNILAKDAFINFYTLMNDVTLAPGMGAYLNMLNSAKPATINGVVQIANENYPRELMQLFTTGIDMINQDGSLQLDANGNAVPVYTEAQVQAFARAYTGWTYGKPGGVALTGYPNNTADYDDPMQAYEGQHDEGSKTLLNGTTLPAGQTSAQDLAGALTNIFNHPNVGPFVSRQLIQHLVASQPSPAYVSRVAAIFANDGTGVRGNMKAVIQAIMSDQDARAGDTSPNFDGGHLREPMLYLTNVVRGLGFTNNDAVAGNDVVANASYSSLSNYSSPLGQKPYTSGSVFNFFPPDYVIPGTTTNAPEFGQENTATAVLRLSLANTLVFNGISGFTVNLGATSALGMMASATGNATTDSTNLVNALGTIFMHGQMPAQMSAPIIAHVATIVGNPAERVRVATYLVITASQYKIEH